MGYSTAAFAQTSMLKSQLLQGKPIWLWFSHDTSTNEIASHISRCITGSMRGSFQMVELGRGNDPVRTFDAVIPSVLLQS